MIDFLGYLLTSIILILIILTAVYFINIPTYDYEKHSAYECGFEPFGDARGFFDVHFYVIGILFIIFDLEIVYLIPFVVDVSNISAIGYFSMIIFMAFVLVGFYYEWVIGLLNWLPSKSQVTKNKI
jgi:NADH-quinone oxidoreductase subunit A